MEKGIEQVAKLMKELSTLKEELSAEEYPWRLEFSPEWKVFTLKKQASSMMPGIKVSYDDLQALKVLLKKV